jgi:hypothetical protein
MAFPLRTPGQNWYRILQTLRQVTSWDDPEVDSSIRTLLNAEQWRLVQRLSPADRRHLLTVHRELVRQGFTDPHLLRAALLHDIGKADDRGRVTLAHRIMKVALRWSMPGVLSYMARENRGWLAHGLHLALHHPGLGANRARLTGASERTCWLIAHHHDDTIRGDQALEALRTIDEKE